LKYRKTPAFESDYRKLSRTERDAFRAALKTFIPAAERAATGSARWPKSLRVRAVQAAPGVWELTWSFAGPDGRATFEWIEIEGERAILWRRIGGHAIFKRP
jgi:hypothetical protein